MSERDDKLSDASYLDTLLYTSTKEQVIKAMRFLTPKDKQRLIKELQTTKLEVVE